MFRSLAQVDPTFWLPRVIDRYAGSRIAAVLSDSADNAPRADERAYARRAVEWLEGKRIGDRERDRE